MASIKPNKSAGTFASWPGRRRAEDSLLTNVPLQFVITMAYRVKDFQLSGAPAWLMSERYDIEAKAEGNPSFDAMLPMVQTLLEDRLQLKFHRETKELPVYALVVAKAGKLHEAEGECGPRPNIPPPPPEPGKLPTAPCGGFFVFPGHLSGQKVGYAQLVDSLSRFTGRVVLDKTNLTGKYDINLDYTPEQGQFQGAARRCSAARSASAAADRSQRTVPVHGPPGTARLEIGIAKGPGGNAGHRSRGAALGKLTPCFDALPSRVLSSAPWWRRASSEFEAVSIKPNKSGDVRAMFRPSPGGRLSATNVTAKALIEWAYGVRDFQLSGEPGWADSERFDVIAKSDGNPRYDFIKPELETMFQSVLADRFKLAMHRTTKEMPIYSLVIAKNGPKIQLWTKGIVRKSLLPQNPCRSLRPNKFGQLTAEKAPLPALALVLDRLYREDAWSTIPDSRAATATRSIGRNISSTGAARTVPRTPRPREHGIGDRTALEEQLGLNWIRQSLWKPSSITERPLGGTTGLEIGIGKRPMWKMIVIDHLERPSEN